MSEESLTKGQCLCGAITVSANIVSKNVGACHCSKCRRWGSSPMMTVDCGSQISIDGKENIKVFDSSDWAERAFCSLCGSHLYYRLKQNNQYIMSVGLFQDKSDLEFDHQIFIDEKPDYYSFANDTEKLTGAEVFAKYAASSE